MNCQCESKSKTCCADGSGNNQQAMRMALDPVQSDFLALNIKNWNSKPYNIHELPTVEGRPFRSELF